MRFLGALWMICLFAAGCGNHDVTHSTAPEAVALRQNHPTFELIERLEKAPSFTPEQVMKTMRVELHHDPENSGPAFKAYTQPASPASPYKAVELRMPNGIGSSDQLLRVQLASDGGVSQKEIIAHYGLEFDTQVPSPEVRDRPLYLRYRRPGGYLSLGVTNDDDARLVSFVISKGEQ